MAPGHLGSHSSTSGRRAEPATGDTNRAPLLPTGWREGRGHSAGPRAAPSTFPASLVCVTATWGINNQIRDLRGAGNGASATSAPRLLLALSAWTNNFFTRHIACLFVLKFSLVLLSNKMFR